MWHRKAPAAAIVFVAMVGVLLVTWAATVGPSRLLDGDGPGAFDHAALNDGTRSEPPDGRLDGEDTEQAEQSDGSRVGNLVVDVMSGVLAAGAIVAVALLGYAAYRGVRRLRVLMRERRGLPDPEATDYDVPDAPARLARALSEDGDRQRALLQEGSPRNGIVRCWHRLEEVAAEADVGRKPWETPGEFALRLLSTVDADEDASYRLTLLYREARFSHHELDESARDEALEALVTIHLGLAERTGSLR